MSELSVPDLAGAVLDGTPIDWAAAESTADDDKRLVIRELKVVAALAEVHRRLLLPDTVPATADDDQEGTLTEWAHLRGLQRIGQGVFGEVYRAWDPRLDREVALKLIDANSNSHGDSSSPMIQEGRLLARIRHPNVVTIYGAEQIDNRIGLWMEFVRGRTLKEIVDGGKTFSGAEAVAIGVDLAGAVGAVHDAGVLHRDIKAQNVMLADDGRVVLMDFGTGCELAEGYDPEIAGTPLYLAPEVLADGTASVESDIYSLGVLLYYLVTGTYPISAHTVSDLRLAHRSGDRTSLGSVRKSDLSSKFVRLIERAIEPRPEDRYRSAAALATDLAALLPFASFRRIPNVVVAAAILLLVVGLGWEAIGRRVGSPQTPRALLSRVVGFSPAIAGPVIPSPPIIAVLPFDNLSQEARNEDFVDGLSEELIRDLSAIRGLQVKPRDSSFAFKQKAIALVDVGRKLGVNLVVDGSVIRSDSRLLINAHLFRVDGEVLLWSESFDREAKDIFDIQDEIARAIVNKLQLTLGRGQRRYETNVAAYELYLEGRALLSRRRDSDVQKAAEVFKQVVAKDPRFAPAHAGLAIASATLSILPSGSAVPFVEAHAIIRPAAMTAGELDPRLADAHEALGWMYSRELDWSNAEKAFQRGLDLSPTFSRICSSYSTSTLRPMGKHAEALRLLRMALQNDPLSLDLQREIAFTQMESGQYDEAIEALQRVLQVEPDYPYVKSFMARALVFAGRPAEALQLFEELGVGPRGRRNPRMVLAYVALGRRTEAEALAAEHQDGAPSGVAVMAAALGDKDRAFAALDRMAFVEPQRLSTLLSYPEMAVLRGDPRYAALRQRLRLPPR